MNKPRGRVPTMTQKLIRDYPEIPEKDHICLKSGRWKCYYMNGWGDRHQIAQCSKCPPDQYPQGFHYRCKYEETT